MMNLEEKIEQALDEIRPFLKNDGGNVKLVKVEENIVYVKLTGNCSSCSISNTTMTLGVESTVKKYLPQIEKVLSVS